MKVVGKFVALVTVAVNAGIPFAHARLSASDINDTIPQHRQTQETWDCPAVNIHYPTDTCIVDGKTVHRWTLNQVETHSKQSACLMAIYDTVYEVKGFVDIHRGGPDSIVRNCGNDATFGYESLACIAGVPDHIPGVLSMLDGNFCSSVAGVIKNSGADPCRGEPEPLPVPDFEGCPVYDVLTCDHLANMENGGHWTIEMVQATSHASCYAVLYNYVFALGLPPQNNPFTPPGSGTLSFENKHGGGPVAVRNNCRTDMTNAFELMVNTPGVPDHTKGGLNAILPYLVGVIEDSDVDPCVVGQAPPHPCNAFVDDPALKYFAMTQVQTSDRSRCYVVVLGKVYDVKDFQQHHHGGADEIQEHCRQDITGDFFEKPFHTLVQLGAIQQFQLGVIQDSIADPCGANYVPNPDGANYAADGSSDEEEEEEEEEEDSDEEEDEDEKDESELEAEEEETGNFPFTFKDKRGRERTCEWLESKKTRIKNSYCSRDGVRSACPVCDDSGNEGPEIAPKNIFQFKDNKGKTRTCAWLEGRKKRIQKYCRQAAVQSACPDVC